VLLERIQDGRVIFWSIAAHFRVGCYRILTWCVCYRERPRCRSAISKDGIVVRKDREAEEEKGCRLARLYFNHSLWAFIQTNRLAKPKTSIPWTSRKNPPRMQKPKLRTKATPARMAFQQSRAWVGREGKGDGGGE
jgi:hypothetical protein